MWIGSLALVWVAVGCRGRTPFSLDVDLTGDLPVFLTEGAPLNALVLQRCGRSAFDVNWEVRVEPLPERLVYGVTPEGGEERTPAAGLTLGQRYLAIAWTDMDTGLTFASDQQVSFVAGERGSARFGLPCP